MRTYLALGDSYTCGESVAAELAFPRQLVARLRGMGTDIADPKILAVTGWTTNELQTAIKEDNDPGTYDLVTLLIGVNNQCRGTEKGYILEGYQAEFAELLDTAIRFAGNKPDRVIVLSIPDWSVVPFAKGQDHHRISADIDAYNAINRAEALKRHTHYLDITPSSRQAAHDPALVASDGLHPSGSMYTQWVERLLPVAAKILQ